MVGNLILFLKIEVLEAKINMIKWFDVAKQPLEPIKKPVLDVKIDV